MQNYSWTRLSTVRHRRLSSVFFSGRGGCDTGYVHICRRYVGGIIEPGLARSVNSFYSWINIYFIFVFVCHSYVALPSSCMTPFPNSQSQRSKLPPPSWICKLLFPALWMVRSNFNEIQCFLIGYRACKLLASNNLQADACLLTKACLCMLILWFSYP